MTLGEEETLNDVQIIFFCVPVSFVTFEDGKREASRYFNVGNGTGFSKIPVSFHY